MAIDEREVRRIAELARLALGEGEIARMAEELGRIVAYVDQLAEVDVSGVVEAPGALGPSLPLREDAVGESLAPEVALGQAPRAVNGSFAVPAFVDEG